MWNGKSLVDTTLAAAGFVVELSREAHGGACTTACLRDLTVFDHCGAYRLVARYCNCPSAPSDHIQLLRARRWWAAMPKNPTSAFTSGLLAFFRELQNRNKSAPDIFHGLIIQHAKDAGLNPEIVRFLSILLVVIPLTCWSVSPRRGHCRFPILLRYSERSPAPSKQTGRHCARAKQRVT